MAAGLAVKFRDLLPVLGDGAGGSRSGLAFGYDFIEKFVQLAFRVPAPQVDQLDQFLNAMGQGATERSPLETSSQNTTQNREDDQETSEQLQIPEDQSETPEIAPGEAEDTSPPVPPEADAALSPATDRRWENLVLRPGQESPNMRAIVKWVAPTLEFNPRRLKQFVNIFRLQLYIAFNTGLLHAHRDAEEDDCLTPEQIGKFVAISLRWPLLLLELERQPDLLQRLAKYAEVQQAAHMSANEADAQNLNKDEEFAALPEYWRQQQDLLNLLRLHAFPFATAEEELSDDRLTEETGPGFKAYSLSKVDIGKLLQVMPRVSPPTDLSPPTETPPVEGSSSPSTMKMAGSPIDIDMVPIAAGEFLMGDDNINDDEKPQRSVYLDAYEIARYPVTNAQYKIFLDANPNHPEPRQWQNRQYPEAKADHPVVHVSWEGAQAFVEWLSRETRREYRLPTEAEWEKAARGPDGRQYPWGDDFDSKKCNTAESEKKDTTPVRAYPDGASPFGVQDMAGNVWEWCADWFDSNYYKSGPDRNPTGPEKGESRVLRGGSWYSLRDAARCAYRLHDVPDLRFDYVGFRFSRTIRP